MNVSRIYTLLVFTSLFIFQMEAQEITNSIIESANQLYETGDFSAAFNILISVNPDEEDLQSRSALAESITNIGNTEYEKRNFKNAYESFRAALRLQFTNQTATTMYLKMRREMDVNNLSNANVENVVEPSILAPELPLESSSDEIASVDEENADEAEPQDPFIQSEMGIDTTSYINSLETELKAHRDQLERIITSRSDTTTATLNNEDKETLDKIITLLSEFSMVQQSPFQSDSEQLARLEAEVQEVGQEMARLNEFWLEPSLMIILPVVGGAFALIVLLILIILINVNRRNKKIYEIANETSPRLVTAPSVTTQFIGNSGRALLDSPEETSGKLPGTLFEDEDEHTGSMILETGTILSIPQKVNQVLGGQDRSIITAKLSRAVGKKLGLSQQECQKIYLGAMVHDAGYLMLDIGRLRRIIKKPSPLTPKERSFIELHPLQGPHYFTGFAIPSFLRNAMIFHHERLDGSGYPLGLAGDEIPLSAQIIGACETIVALTSTRPFRKRLELSEALELINHDRDIKFDGAIVDATMSVVKVPMTH